MTLASSVSNPLVKRSITHSITHSMTHDRYGTAIIVLTSLDGSGKRVSNAYYLINLIILTVALALLVLMALFFAHRLNSARKRVNRTWRKRQTYLLLDAVVVGSLTMVDVSCVVAAYALYVAAECFPSETALIVIAFVRMVTFTGVVAWMTTTATLLQVIGDKGGHRGGSGARGNQEVGDDGIAQVDNGAASDPTGPRRLATKVRLLVDEPISVILRKRYVWI